MDPMYSTMLHHVGRLLCNKVLVALYTARRKRKWSVDPRNSAWSNDDSKFGQKMLERMGWSKGKVSEISQREFLFIYKFRGT